MVQIPSSCVFLLDIEGTTTSISFVKDVLFPYAINNLENHIDLYWSDDSLSSDIDLLRKQSIDDASKGLIEKPLPANGDASLRPQLIDYVKYLISIDRKCTCLKQLQGHIWKGGFETGKIKGHVYDDVPKALENWKNEHHCNIYIYSSGSIEAQRLLFGHTNHGNLLPLISGHFDTTTGPKQEIDSYRKIAEQINRQPHDIVFLTDVQQEALAAHSAGLFSIIVHRPGNAEVDPKIEQDFPGIKSFDEIKIVKSG